MNPQRQGLTRIPIVLRCALAAMLVLWALLAAAAGTGTTAADDDGLRPGEFVWMPELAPRGPVAVIVSLPQQRAYVYRNGVRIGRSTASTGRPGYDTPSGIYSILQKRREHYSNLYDNAPMPFMQRLTWGGVALHAGNLPGYPASHGCVRLPRQFAEHLFAATKLGTIVVVADTRAFPPSIVSPGLFSPIDPATGATRPLVAAPPTGGWHPERSPEGPMTILLSTSDRIMVVSRNGVEIGRSAVSVDASAAALGTRAYLLLDDGPSGSSASGPDNRVRRWQKLSMAAPAVISDDAVREAFETGRISVPAAFARVVEAALLPGTTMLLTDEPLQAPGSNTDVLTTGDASRR